VHRIVGGTAARISQDESLATYDPLCRDRHVGIDWARPAREVYDLVRGSDPQPGAWAVRHGEKIRFYDCRLAMQVGGEPGRVLAVDETGAEVALAGGRLRVKRMRLGESPKKAAPAELAATGRLAVGDRLGPGESHEQ